MKMESQWGNWINLILGAWFFATPWAFDYGFNLSDRTILLANINAWVVGTVVVVSAVSAISDLKPWEEWVNLILGIWLIFSPFIIGTNEQSNLMWNSVIVGVLIAVISGIELPMARKLQRQ